MLRQFKWFKRAISSWTMKNLSECNIVIKAQSRTEFFGNSLATDLPSQIREPFEAFVAESTFQGVPTNTKAFSNDLFIPLSRALMSKTGQEPAGDHLGTILLKRLGYIEGNRTLHARNFYRFSWQATDRRVAPNWAITDANGYILFLGEKKRLGGYKDQEAQVVGQALAAFTHNNRIREQNGLEKLDRITFPAITLVGDSLEFYKIPVSSKLITALEEGKRPEEATIVLRYSTRPQTEPGARRSRKPLGLELAGRNCMEVLAFMNTFKKFLDSKESQTRWNTE